jgi:hypothetical protein
MTTLKHPSPDYERIAPPLIALLAVLSIFAVALGLSGCTTYQLQRQAVRAEKILDAQEAEWGRRFAEAYDACEAAHPDRGPERDACVAEVDRIDDAVAGVVTAAVAAGRAFWLGMAIGENPTDLRRHAADLVTAVAGFPLEALGKTGGAR